MSDRHKEALAHLLFGIKIGDGFVALTGEVGTGKTTLCRSLLDQLPEKTDVALIVNPKLNGLELLGAICDELQINYPQGNQSLKTLVDLINEFLLHSHAKGRQTVLIIDEAQNLSLDVLEQIRLLTNLETNENKLLQIILVGQPELQLLLNCDELRQLNQRITARYHLLPLSEHETRAYIRHYLSVSKGRSGLFSNAAIRKIHKLTQGVPRLINILCDRSLLGAYATDKKRVNSRIVKKAALEVFSSNKQPALLQVAWICAVLFIVSAGLYGYYHFNDTQFSLFSLKRKASVSIKPIEKAPDRPNELSSEKKSASKPKAPTIVSQGLTQGNQKKLTKKVVQQGDTQSAQLLHLIQDREIGNQQSEINLENIPEKTHPFHESENPQKSELLHESEWLLSKNKDHYTIQVIALYSSEQIKRFADQYTHQGEWAYYAKHKNRKRIYVLIRCCFDSKADAQKEKENLPVELKKINPFLVKLDNIQNIIKEGLK